MNSRTEHTHNLLVRNDGHKCSDKERRAERDKRIIKGEEKRGKKIAWSKEGEKDCVVKI
jgi:hypothetical protein